MFFNKKLSNLLLLTSAALSFPSFATIVEVQTSQGNFQINLHDEATPKTVANFLKYVSDGDYDNTIFHRSVGSSTPSNIGITQAGGFSFEGTLPPTPIEVDASVINEPVYSNVRGTIAMAKQGNKPNSATSQWFVNLQDNSINASSLDLQNSGFTVFGEIIDIDTAGDSMTVIDNIAAIDQCDTDPLTASAFDNLPMPNYSAEQCADSNSVPGVDNFVTIISITVLDSSTTTADTLTPTKNTLLNATPTPTPTSSDGGGGGSFAWLSLCLVGLLSLSRYSRK